MTDYLLEKIEKTIESVEVGWNECIHQFGNAGRFWCSDEEQQDGQYGESQGNQIGFTFAGHFIISKESEADSAEEGDDQTGEREDAKEKICHQESYEENGKENEGQIISNQGRVHMAAHIIQPVSHVKSEKAKRNGGKNNDLVPDACKTVSVLTEPPEEYTDQECCHTADDVIDSCRNKFNSNHRNGGENRTGNDPGGKLSLGSPLFFWKFFPHLMKDFCHEYKKENSKCGERIYKERSKNKCYWNEKFISFENLKILEI